MGFNLTKPFDGAMQSVPYSDPWGGGVTFHVRPIFYGPFSRALKAERGGGVQSMMRRVLAKAGKTYAKAMGPGGNGPAVADGAEPAPELTYEALIEQAWREVIDETDESEFAAFSDSSTASALPADTVALLVEGVDGLVNDRNEAATVEEIPALLADDSIVSAGLPYAGMEAGLALRLWLVEKARESAAALAAAAESAGKASAPSSAGATRSSRSESPKRGRKPSGN